MNSPRVLVAGAINTDLVARTPRAPGPGETVTGSSFAIFGGGKGANQAVAAARAGADTSLLGAVGDDAFGTERRAHLAADGIDLESVATISGVASGVALISVEPSGQNRILYVPGATLEAQAHHARKAVVRVRPSVVLMTLELPSETLAALVTKAKGLGATIALNATPEPELARRFLPDTDVLIVNEPEASALVGHTVTLETSAVAAEALRGMGPGTAIITLGEQGAVAVSNEGMERVKAPVVEVVDTTGAGDTLCGALVAALAEGQTLREALRFGVAAASLAVTRAGAQASIPRREEIERHVSR